MVREQCMKIAKINIVTQPHSSEKYCNLIEAIYKKPKPFRVRGIQSIMIVNLKYIDSNDRGRGYFGQIIRFIEIDKNAPWFNIENSDVASDDELATINIPEHLRPNLEKFEFVFYPKVHAFYVTTKINKSSLSVRFVEKMLKSLFSDKAIQENFGEVNISIFPDKETLKSIFGMHQLRNLYIEVTLPNPDDLATEEAEVFRRLQTMNTRKMDMHLKAEQGKSIDVDQDIRILANVAANGNGKVIGEGKLNDGQSIKQSTVDKPWEETIKYNPNQQEPRDALITQTKGLPGSQ